MPASAKLPSEIRKLLREAAARWYESEARPRVDPDVEAHWDALIKEWVADITMPLLVRRSKERGVLVQHPDGGTVVAVDNSPAHWVMSAAVAGERPSLRDVRHALTEGSLPVVHQLSAAGQRKATYTACLSQCPNAKRLNDAGWKVCHIRPVGLGQREPFHRLRRAVLADHSKLLLTPGNMFVVPNLHAGFGELPEVLTHFHVADIGGAV